MSRFDKAAKTWDQSDRRQIMAAEIAAVIHNNIHLDTSMQLLDFGAGTGLLTQHLADHVAKITAVDLSSEMLKVLQQRAEHWGTGKVETIHTDILKYQSTQHYDGIVSSMSMHHIQDLNALFKKFSSLLRPGGFIAIADLDTEDGSFHEDGNDGVFHFGFEQTDLTLLAQENGFEKISFREAHRIKKASGNAYTLFLMTAYKKRQ